MKRYDEKVLHLLLDRYENSLLYSGKNQVNITIAVPVQKSTLPEYFDEASLQFDVIHEQLLALEQKGYVQLVWKNKKQGHILQKCVLVTERAEEVYRLLGRKKRSDKEAAIRAVCSIYRERAAAPGCVAEPQASAASGCTAEPQASAVLNGTAALIRFLDWIEARIDAGESVRKYVDSEDVDGFSRLLEVVLRILTNDEECFLRQFSVRYFHDSKLAEKEIDKAVHIIVQFSEGEELEGLDTTEVLEEFNIYRNPSWVMMKGYGVFEMDADTAKQLSGALSQQKHSREMAAQDEMLHTVVNLQAIPGGIGIANEDMDNIRWSKQYSPERVLTIENLTSFHQWSRIGQEDKRTLCIYLGGYHNRAKRSFLQSLYRAYPRAEYCHFGDIDCGGFRIWKDLCRKTGIAFHTMWMDADTYWNYYEQGRELTVQDRKTLLMMKEDPFYTEQRALFELMLQKGRKVEQEGII